MQNLSSIPTPLLLALIEESFQVQRKNHPDSAVAEAARSVNRPRFAEMAARQAANGGERDPSKWAPVL